LEKRASSVIVSPSEMRRSFSLFPCILETFPIVPDYSGLIQTINKKQKLSSIFYGLVILLSFYLTTHRLYSYASHNKAQVFFMKHTDRLPK
jgi:hypothetical protein